ncbi:hypothetical protein TELCIR_10589 [Teladorsagia circumcincta]|uniref:Endonuclease/exonuclease/phosphatase domain-containing protein n=1 Tax=Teladorsagia circumcincta TaxID=45464 RepID=A0A2G9UBP2_TELCI|nr:hypothetical protein TELCIR_10589 [Teladorsagia circumcincta]
MNIESMINPLIGQPARETRWKGAKAREIGEGVKLYYNGEDTKRNGVAIAVAESLKDYVSAVNRVSDRIMAVRIDAPQAGCPESEKDKFYQRLDDAIRSTPEGDYLTIAGDLNGHPGTDRRGTAAIQLKGQEQRLRWYGHVLSRPQDHPIRRAMDFEAQGKRPRGAPKKRWKDVIKKDLTEVRATAEDRLIEHSGED